MLKSSTTEKYACHNDNISQIVVSPNDVSCSEKEDIALGETEVTSMMSGQTKTYLMWLNHLLVALLPQIYDSNM